MPFATYYFNLYNGQWITVFCDIALWSMLAFNYPIVWMTFPDVVAAATKGNI